jgi:class 3 adenylate cyclase
MEMNRELDIRHVLPAVRAPTLVLHREHEAAPVAEGRYVAERISAAEFVLLPPGDYAFFSQPEAIVAEAQRFLGELWDRGEWDEVGSERVLATILFTDIVGSTAKAAAIGDARWRELLETHHRLIRRQLSRFRGRELDTAGDGFLASFDGPARAIQCAHAIIAALQDLDLGIRAGVHTGECELVNGKVGGIAVHIGARVAAEATAGEVLVSSTVKDIVAGSGLHFTDRGSTELKGVPGQRVPARDRVPRRLQQHQHDPRHLARDRGLLDRHATRELLARRSRLRPPRRRRLLRQDELTKSRRVSERTQSRSLTFPCDLSQHERNSNPPPARPAQGSFRNTGPGERCNPRCRAISRGLPTLAPLGRD